MKGRILGLQSKSKEIAGSAESDIRQSERDIPESGSDYGDKDGELHEFKKTYGTKNTKTTLQVRNELISEVNKTLEDESRSDYKARQCGEYHDSP